MAVTAALDAVEKNSDCICVRWCTSDEMDHRACGKELEYRALKLGNGMCLRDCRLKRLTHIA